LRVSPERVRTENARNGLDDHARAVL